MNVGKAAHGSVFLPGVRGILYFMFYYFRFVHPVYIFWVFVMEDIVALIPISKEKEGMEIRNVSMTGICFLFS